MDCIERNKVVDLINAHNKVTTDETTCKILKALSYLIADKHCFPNCAEIAFTNEDDLKIYNKKLIVDFIKYLNQQHNKSFNYDVTIQICENNELIDNFLNHISLNNKES